MTEPIGPQHARAAAGTDPRGALVFEWLPDDLQRLEDSRAVADREQAVIRSAPQGFERPATDTEKLLLAHLGHDIPEGLLTVVSHALSVRKREWPQIGV